MGSARVGEGVAVRASTLAWRPGRPSGKCGKHDPGVGHFPTIVWLTSTFQFPDLAVRGPTLWAWRWPLRLPFDSPKVLFLELLLVGSAGLLNIKGRQVVRELIENLSCFMIIGE